MLRENLGLFEDMARCVNRWRRTDSKVPAYPEPEAKRLLFLQIPFSFFWFCLPSSHNHTCCYQSWTAPSCGRCCNSILNKRDLQAICLVSWKTKLFCKSWPINFHSQNLFFLKKRILYIYKENTDSRSRDFFLFEEHRCSFHIFSRSICNI